MTVRITQIEDEDRERAVLQVEGKLHGCDAEILEQAFDELQSRNRSIIDVDITGISFIDGDGAAALKRIKARGAALTGLDFFIEKVIETYEENQTKEEKNI